MTQSFDKDQTPFVERLRAEALETDKADLLAILAMRFGTIPEMVQSSIGQLSDGGKVERLVLVAANVPDFGAFVEELGEGAEAFRLVGERFNPLAK